MRRVRHVSISPSAIPTPAPQREYKSAHSSQPNNKDVSITITHKTPRPSPSKKMVNLTAIIASNERISSALPPGLVAVFVGGTSGVGEYTLQAFARYARAPKVIIVGRSREAADRILEECRGVNPEGCFEFVRGDVSLLRNVETCVVRSCRRWLLLTSSSSRRGAWLFNRVCVRSISFSWHTYRLSHQLNSPQLNPRHIKINVSANPHTQKQAKASPQPAP